MSALILHEVDFAYRSAAAIRRVSLQVHPGDIYGFLGHNGAGKTTIMRMALGLLRPQHGSVRIFGHDPWREPVASHALIGSCNEHPGFHLHVSVKDNLLLLARLQGLSSADSARDVVRVLTQVNLLDVALRPVGQLSFGMRQRLNLAQALLGQPRLLILDEPTNGLDPDSVAALQHVVKQLSREDGVAILWSSHQLAELDVLCNRIAILREGAVVVDGDLTHLRQQLTTPYIIRGTPLASINSTINDNGGTATIEDDHLIATLSNPPAVFRALAPEHEIVHFAPQTLTLATVYQHAANLQSQTPRPVFTVAQSSPNVPGWGWVRVWRYDLTRFYRWPTLCVWLLPAAFGAARVLYEHQRVGEYLNEVQAGTLFSADSGSGYLASAIALQSILPILGVIVLWWSAQSIAADATNDTLRQMIIRPVSRWHVALGKLASLGTVTLVSWFITVLAIMLSAALLFGYDHLYEIMAKGSPQILADARDVWPIWLNGIVSTALPLLALAAFGCAMSALFPRPVRAVTLSITVLIGLELFRNELPGRGAWLLTSHLPLGLHDNSAIAYVVACSRGAADAYWPWASWLWGTSLAWLMCSIFACGFGLRRWS